MSYNHSINCIFNISIWTCQNNVSIGLMCRDLSESADSIGLQNVDVFNTEACASLDYIGRNI